MDHIEGCSPDCDGIRPSGYPCRCVCHRQPDHDHQWEETRDGTMGTRAAWVAECAVCGLVTPRFTVTSG